MLFLNPFYNYLANHFSSRINHFPLIRLSIKSLDKPNFYTIIFIVLRFIYNKRKKRKVKWKKELLILIYAFYLILLYSLTVFRFAYFPWQLHPDFHRSLSEINVVPLVNTFKLVYGQSPVDFIYNLYGNILWFVPFGILYPMISKKRQTLISVTFKGMLISISIECLQFILHTGISDIDDVIFNTLGVIVGYCIYQIFRSINNSIKRHRKR